MTLVLMLLPHTWSPLPVEGGSTEILTFLNAPAFSIPYSLFPPLSLA